jgi:hypothetical protein
MFTLCSSEVTVIHLKRKGRPSEILKALTRQACMVISDMPALTLIILVGVRLTPVNGTAPRPEIDGQYCSHPLPFGQSTGTIAL